MAATDYRRAEPREDRDIALQQRVVQGVVPTCSRSLPRCFHRTHVGRNRRAGVRGVPGGHYSPGHSEWTRASGLGPRSPEKLSSADAVWENSL